MNNDTLNAGEISRIQSSKTLAMAMPHRNGNGMANIFLSCAQYEISLREDTVSTGMHRYLITETMRSKMRSKKCREALIQGKLLIGRGPLPQKSLKESMAVSRKSFWESSDSLADMSMARIFDKVLFDCNPPCFLVISGDKHPRNRIPRSS